MRNNQKVPFVHRVARFMYGRNGYDRLCRGAMILCMALAVLNIFFHSVILIAIEAILLGYALFRAFSKNLFRRQRENAAYCRIESKLTKPFRLMGNKWRDRKTHVYRKCPHCKNVLRLPRRAGKHTVNCPCCHKRFDVKV